jgi:branched-chain amino acid transport system ATP-binding protein
LEKNDLILKIENLTVTYGHVQALTNISFDVAKGESVALIGANNAGKSTLVKAIMNLNKKEEGRVIFKQNDITNYPPDKIVLKGICIIPEGRGILSLLTVIENLQLGGYHHKKKMSENLERVFERFPVLKDRRKQTAGTLSGGEQQMLSIAMGLMSEPELMLFDEPSLGLSPLIIEEVMRIINDLHQSGYTILLSEQNAKKALQVCDRGFVFEKGRVVLSGDTEKLSREERVRHAYLGGAVE